MKYSSVPTSLELENSGGVQHTINGKKYTVNNNNPSVNKLQISKTLCVLLSFGAIFLAMLTALLVFILAPRCLQSNNDALAYSDDAGNDISTRIKEIDPRLPLALKPLHYKLEIVPDFQRLSLDGRIQINLKTLEETDEIILNVKNVSINETSLSLMKIHTNETLELTGINHLQSDRLRISTEKTLETNENYVLEIDFTTEFNQHLQGVYMSRYFDLREKRTKTLVSTQFSPIDARQAFPCFDEPSFKSVFSISIARPKHLTTISNAPLKGPPEPFEDTDDWVWDNYQDTPPIPSYLVAFVISDFEPFNSSKTNVKLWSTKSFLPQTKYAADLTPKITDFLGNYLNYSFPGEKLDLVAVPEFGFGAMENYGLITFRESMLLFDKNNTSIEDQKSIAQVLSHELAHQWFGNLVTPKWWDDLWLKEGFATYFSYLAVDHVHPNWEFKQEMLPYEVHKAMEYDSYSSAEAVSSLVESNQEIRRNFGSKSYSKGACLVRMMKEFLTETTFKKGLSYYFERYKYKNADRKDLFKCFDDAAAEDLNPLTNITSVGEIMDEWLNKPGFPVLILKTDLENKTITIRQRRFLLNDDKDDETTTKWWIPISIATDLENSFDKVETKIWLKNETITIPVNFSEWFIVNVNQTGYYMVNYDETMWHSLIKNIMNVPALTRAQLIGDSMELARAGLLDYDVPLRLIANMAVNDKLIMFVPTLVAFNKLEFLSDMLVNTPAFGLFEKYQRTIFKDTYNIVDFANEQDDYLSLRIMKTVLEWSCRSTESRCAIIAHNLFRKWMQRATKIPPNLRHIVYCTAIRQGSKPEWDFAYHEYRRTNSPTEKNVLLDALGCTKQEWLLSRYLNIVLDDETYSMQIQDADRIFESIANNKAGNQLAFNFLRRNWKDLQAHLGEGFNILNKLILSLPRHMSTEFQLAELRNFKREIGNEIGSAGLALERAIEIVKTKVEWMQKNIKSVEQWFHSHQDHFNYLG